MQQGNTICLHLPGFDFLLESRNTAALHSIHSIHLLFSFPQKHCGDSKKRQYSKRRRCRIGIRCILAEDFRMGKRGDGFHALYQTRTAAVDDVCTNSIHLSGFNGL